MSTNLTTAEQLSSLASAVKGKLNVLDTLPSTVNGGLWFEGGGSVPIIKLYYGGNAFKITPELVAIKATPTLTVTKTRIAPPDSRTTITYNGDGNLYLFDFIGNVEAAISGNLITIYVGAGCFKVGATEGTNYAAATPVTITVFDRFVLNTELDDFVFFSLDVDGAQDETTMAIEELCDEGIDNEDNVLAYWDENTQAALEGLGGVSYEYELFNVQLAGTVPDEPVSITAYPNIAIDDGWIYYVIFTTDENVADYTLIEAVGQSGTTFTFELPVAFIAEYLDTPMTMIVLKAQE